MYVFAIAYKARTISATCDADDPSQQSVMMSCDTVPATGATSDADNPSQQSAFATEQQIMSSVRFYGRGFRKARASGEVSSATQQLVMSPDSEPPAMCVEGVPRSLHPVNKRSRKDATLTAGRRNAKSSRKGRLPSRYTD